MIALPRVDEAPVGGETPERWAAGEDASLGLERRPALSRVGPAEIHQGFRVSRRGEDREARRVERRRQAGGGGRRDVRDVARNDDQRADHELAGLIGQQNEPRAQCDVEDRALRAGGEDGLARAAPGKTRPTTMGRSAPAAMARTSSSRTW